MKVLFVAAIVVLASSEARNVRGEKTMYFSTKSFEPSLSSEQGSLLDTFSLSFAGSFDFARTLDGIMKIFEGISSFIDLKVIRAGVEMMFETLFPKSVKVKTLELSSRSDQYLQGHLQEEALKEAELEYAKHERLKSGLTTIVGAVMRKQNCWELSACTVGSYIQEIQGKDVIFILAERVMPKFITPTLDIVKKSAYSNYPSCPFQCDPNIDGRALNQHTIKY